MIVILKTFDNVLFSSKSKSRKDSRLQEGGTAEVSQTTITEDTENTTEITAAYLNNLNVHKDYCRRVRMKEKIATESVVILGSYFTLTFGSFIVFQYFMPPQFYDVVSVTKYNTLLLVQLLLLLNSTLNPLIHYWRNPKIRRRVNTLLGITCRFLFSGSIGISHFRQKSPAQGQSKNNHLKSGIRTCDL